MDNVSLPPSRLLLSPLPRLTLRIQWRFKPWTQLDLCDTQSPFDDGLGFGLVFLVTANRFDLELCNEEMENFGIGPRSHFSIRKLACLGARQN